MKKYLIITFLILNQLIIYAQGNSTVTNRIPTGNIVAINQYGKTFTFDDLKINTSSINKKRSGSSPIAPAIAGIFRLYFNSTNNGIYQIDLTDNSQISKNYRNVFIEVCKDLSILIGPIASNSFFKPDIETPFGIDDDKYIDLCITSKTLDQISPANCQVLLDARFPSISPTIIQEYIQTGFDPLYDGTNSPHYHGIININNSTSFNFHTDLSTPAINNERDLYSILLHEMLHALGISTTLALENNKENKLLNHFTIWDTFIKDESGINLIDKSLDYSKSSINSSLNLNQFCIINPTKKLFFDDGKNKTPIYTGENIIDNGTGSTYKKGSSFVHYGEIASNDYVMGSQINPAINKRYLDPIEVCALRAIGYTLNAKNTTITFGSGKTTLYLGNGDDIKSITDNKKRVGTTFTNTSNTVVTYTESNIISVNKPRYCIGNIDFDLSKTPFGTYFAVNAGDEIIIKDLIKNDFNTVSFTNVMEEEFYTYNISNYYDQIEINTPFFSNIQEILKDGETNPNTDNYFNLSDDKTGIKYSPDAIEPNHVRMFSYDPISSDGIKGRKGYVYINVIGKTQTSPSCNQIVNGNFSISNQPKDDGRANDLRVYSFNTDIVGWKLLIGTAELYVPNDIYHINIKNLTSSSINFREMHTIGSQIDVMNSRVFGQLNAFKVPNDLYIFKVDYSIQNPNNKLKIYLSKSLPTREKSDIDLILAELPNKNYSYSGQVNNFISINNAEYKYIVCDLNTTLQCIQTSISNLILERTDKFTVTTSQDKIIAQPNSTVNTNIKIEFDTRCLAQKYPFTISLNLPSGITLANNNYFNADGSSKKTYPAGTFSPTSPNNILNIPLVINTGTTVGNKNITINYSFQSCSNTVNQTEKIEFNVQPTVTCLSPATTPVFNSTTGLSYSTIQGAIKDADAGNTLLVCSGTYNENLIIDKPLTISSYFDGTNTAVIASTILKPSSATAPAISILVPNVKLIGFTIRGTTGTELGINNTFNNTYDPANFFTLSNMVLNNLNTPLQITGANVNISNTLTTNCNTNFIIVQSAINIDNLNYYQNFMMPLFVLSGNSSISNSSFNNNQNLSSNLSSEFGIHNDNISINLTKCRFRNNTLNRIINYSNSFPGSIQLDSCCFINNITSENIFLLSSNYIKNTNLNNCLFQKNSSTSLSANIIDYHTYYDYNNNIGELNIMNSTIKDNSEYSKILDIDGKLNNLTINGCTITNNTITTTPTENNACIYYSYSNSNFNTNSNPNFIQNFSCINTTISKNNMVGMYLNGIVNNNITSSTINENQIYSLRITGTGSENLTIANSTISNNNGHILIADINKTTITNSRIEKNIGTSISGIEMIGGGNLNIQNSKFYSNKVTGTWGRLITFATTGGTINAENSIFAGNKNIGSYLISMGFPSGCGSCTNVGFKLNHVTIFDNELTSAAKDIGVNTENNIIQNSIIWDNVAKPLELSNNNSYPINNSKVINSTIRNGLNGISSAFDYTIAPNSVYSFQPEFMNEGDYRPTPESKVINAGIASTITTDIAGTTRDNQPDLGAYEYKIGDATSQNTFPIVDATIGNAAGCGLSAPYPSNQNNGLSNTITASHTPSANCIGESWQKTLIRFDLKSIPANAIITKATFKMIGTGANSNNSRFRKIINPGSTAWNWAENTVTWNSVPQSYYSSTDINIIPVTTVNGNASVDITRFVTFWYRNMDRNTTVDYRKDRNYGMLYELDPSITTTASNSFGSKDNATATLRPTLTVEYFIPSNPEVIVVDEDAKISYFKASGGSAEPSTNFLNDNNETNLEPSTQWTSNKNRRNLLQFNLSSVSQTSVKKATLQLSPLTFSGNNEAIFSKITTAWNPTTVTWNGKPATSTTASDIKSIPAQSVPAVSTNPIYVDVTSIVNSWLSNKPTNYGLMIQLKNESQSAVANLDFASVENDITSLHPRLLLEYDVPNWNGIMKINYEEESVIETQNETLPEIEKNQIFTEQLSVYPVPSHDKIVIDASNISEKIQNIEITDIVGNIIASIKPTDSKTELDASNYANGIYFIKLSTLTKSILGKFIKN